MVMIECLIMKKEYIADINDISTIGVYSCCVQEKKGKISCVHNVLLFQN